MGDAIGNVNKCAFCPNTMNVVRTTLGGYVCADCAGKLVEDFALQKIDLIGVNTICVRNGQELALRFMEFRKTLHSGGNPVFLDEVSKFFLNVHVGITSGRYGELQTRSAKLRDVRRQKREAEEAVVALDGGQQAATLAIETGLAAIERAKEEYDSAVAKLADVQKQKAMAVAERQALEKSEAELAQQIARLLGGLGL